MAVVYLSGFDALSPANSTTTGGSNNSTKQGGDALPAARDVGLTAVVSVVAVVLALVL